jgi:hypothetical protein
LWQALNHDPNQDNGLLWYCSIQQDRAGEQGLWEAMRRAAELPGSWRPQLWLARHALEQDNLAEAQAHYAHVLKLAPDEPDVLLMISGDLGNHGHVAQMLDVVRPIYDPARHHPTAGLNLLTACLQTGRVADGQELLHELFLLNHPDLRDHLLRFSEEFEKQNPQSRARIVAPDEPLSIELAVVERPVWAKGLANPAWLFGADAGRDDEIVFLPLANTTAREATDPYVHREDDLGRLTRSLALYLAEATYFWTDFRPRTVVPVVSGGGPIVVGQPWTPEQIVEFAGDARLAVNGTVAQTREGLRIELALWDCAQRGAIRRFAAMGPADDIGAAVRRLEDELIGAIGATRPSASEDFYRRPDAAVLDRYLCCLGQALTLVLVQDGFTSRDAIWGERNIFQYLLDQVALAAEEQVPRIMFLGALATAHDYGSLVVAEFKQPALHLIDEEQDQRSPVYRLSPLFLRPFDMRRFDERRRELLATARGPYREWLQSLVDA